MKAFVAFGKDVIDSLNMFASNESPESSMPGIEKLFVFWTQPRIKTVYLSRWYLFKKNADCAKLPPTTGALLQHAKRAKLPAMVWETVYNNTVLRGNPVENGWILSNISMYKQIMSLDAMAPEQVLQISKCKCETGCKN